MELTHSQIYIKKKQTPYCSVCFFFVSYSNHCCLMNPEKQQYTLLYKRVKR
ncbi:Uncharacterised protein [Prevotella intermedia]|nr:Uncharacterised protein [Prevotella intermedia]